MATDASGAVFPYPGSKTQLASWIIEQFPRHGLYVEAFGGSAAVLTTKEPSKNEVFNDVDGDIVHFYETLRDRHDELVEWLKNTPFSRDHHKKYAHEFYQGLRPVDDVERAGRFFYLRNTQFAQNFEEVSGFRLGVTRNHGRGFDNRVEALHAFRDRLNHVQIENLDYADLVERTDGPDTLYYFDPPYLNPGRTHYTGHKGFDHERFVDVLEGTEGKWIVSYNDLPEGLQDGYTVVSQERRGTMRNGVDEWKQTNVERLVMNYDPRHEPRWSPDETQEVLADFTQDAEPCTEGGRE